MRKPVRLTRPQRQPLRLERGELAKPVARAVVVSRAGVASRTVARFSVAVPVRTKPAVARPAPAPVGFEPGPYLDYGRFLTPEGGILLAAEGVEAACEV